MMNQWIAIYNTIKSWQKIASDNRLDEIVKECMAIRVHMLKLRDEFKLLKKLPSKETDVIEENRNTIPMPDGLMDRLSEVEDGAE